MSPCWSSGEVEVVGGVLDLDDVGIVGDPGPSSPDPSGWHHRRMGVPTAGPHFHRQKAGPSELLDPSRQRETHACAQTYSTLG